MASFAGQAAQEAQVGRLTPSALRRTLTISFFVSLLEGYDLQVMTAASAPMRAELGLSPAEFGYAFSASVVGLAVGAAVFGPLGDRVGRTRVLTGSLVILALFTAITAHAGGLASLLLWRFCGGLGMGGALPTVIAIVAGAVPANRKTGMVSSIVCMMLGGGVLAALVAHPLIEAQGWRSLFWFGGTLTALAAVASAIFMPREADGQAARRDSIPPLEVLFGGGRARTTPLLWLLFVLTLSIMSLLLGWAPALVMQKGLPPASGFATMLAVNLGGIAGSLVFSRLCDRWSVRGTLLIVYLCMAASLALFAISRSADTIIPLAGVVGAFVLGAQMALYGLSPRFYPVAGHGTGVGAAVAAGRIGSFAGPILGGLLVGTGASADHIALLLVPLALLSCMTMLLLMRGERQIRL